TARHARRHHQHSGHHHRVLSSAERARPAFRVGLPGMDARLVGPSSAGEDEERLQTALRPRTLQEFIGQDAQRNRLSIAVRAARTRVSLAPRAACQRREPLAPLLLSGPPGWGKPTLAHFVSYEMGGKLVTTSGPALERAADLMGMLTRLDQGDVFFIDEIHRM